MRRLEPYLCDELNVQRVDFDSDERAWLSLSAKANFKKLGARLGKRMKEVAAAVERLGPDDLRRLEQGEPVTAGGEPITLDEVEIRRAPRDAKVTLQAHPLVAVALDPTVTPEQREEGLAREVRRRIQMARKLARVRLDAKVALKVYVLGELREAAEARRAWLESETISTITFVDALEGEGVERFDIDGDTLTIALTA
jgi:isoleucyl-tRNA synthetase